MAATGVHMFDGPKGYYDDLETATKTVRSRYPGAWWTGSVCTWCWCIRDEQDRRCYVAEGWMHRTKPGLWLRIGRAPILEKDRLEGRVRVKSPSANCSSG